MLGIRVQKLKKLESFCKIKTFNPLFNKDGAIVNVSSTYGIVEVPINQFMVIQESILQLHTEIIQGGHFHESLQITFGKSYSKE